MARAAQAQGLGAVDDLRARRKVDLGELVVDGLGKGDLHAPDGVDNRGELLEVNLGVVGDLDAGKVGDHLGHVGGATKGIGGVDLLLAVLAHVDEGVAWNGDQGDLLRGRVDAREDDRVGAEVGVAVPPLARAPLALVDAQKQHVEGLLGLYGHELLAQVLGDLAAQAAVDVRKVESRRGADARQDQEKRDKDDAQDAAAALLAAALGVGLDALGARVARGSVVPARAARGARVGGNAVAGGSGAVATFGEACLLGAGHAPVGFSVGHDDPFCRWGQYPASGSDTIGA